MPKKDNDLFCAYLLNGEGGGGLFSWDSVDKWSAECGAMWLHLDVESEVAQAWLREHSGIEDVACEALLADETRPRSTSIGEGLLVILRGVNLNPGADPEDMVSVRLWVDSTRMISLSRRRLRAVQDLATKLDHGSGPKTPTDLFTSLAGHLLERMEPVLQGLGDAIDEQEEQALLAEPGRLQTELAEQRRQVIALQRHMAPQRDAMSTLAQSPGNLLDEEQRALVQFLADQVARHLENLNELRERTQITHDLIASRQAEAMNRRMLMLSIVAAIFLPLSLLTGLLGINVAGIPGASSEWAFLTVCGLLAALAMFQLWILRRRRWF